MGEELTTTERVAFVTWRLMKGDEFTTREIAGLTGLSHTGAWKLMHRISRVLPIYQDDKWRWKLIRREDLRGSDTTANPP